MDLFRSQCSMSFEPFTLDNGSKVEPKEGAKALGSGAQATVLVGIMTKTTGEKEEVAVKCAWSMLKKEADEVLKEINILANLPPHENIICCYGGIWVPCEGSLGKVNVYSVLELMDMDLKHYLLKRSTFTENCTYKDLLELFLLIARGMKHLHSQGVIHHDLKLGNILVAVDGKVKIADLGLAKVLQAGKESMTASLRGTQGYMAPELQIKGMHKGWADSSSSSVTNAVDIYSFGRMLLKCLNYDKSYSYSTWSRQNGRYVAIPFCGGEVEWCHGPPDLCEVIEKCTQFDMRNLASRTHGRPNAEEVIEALESMLQADWVAEKIFGFCEVLEGSSSGALPSQFEGVPKTLLLTSESPIDWNLNLPLELHLHHAGGMVIEYSGEEPFKSHGKYSILPASMLTEEKEEVEVSVECRFVSKMQIMNSMVSKLDINSSLAPHENIVQLFGFAVENYNVSSEGARRYATFTVKERVQGPFRSDSCAQGCTYAELLYIFRQLCAGVAYLHQNRVIHTALAPWRSLFVSKDGTLKVEILEPSKYLQDGEESIPLNDVLPCNSSSPEVWLASNKRASESKRLTKAVDIYSVGSIMWSCLNFKDIGFENASNNGSIHEIKWWNFVTKEAQMIPCNGPKELAELIEDCWRFDMETYERNREHTYGRPTIEEVIERLKSLQKASWIGDKVEEVKEVALKSSSFKCRIS